MATQLTLEQAAQHLCAAQDVLILAHKSPDGDTLGSGFGLLHALRGMGKRVLPAVTLSRRAMPT